MRKILDTLYLGSGVAAGVCLVVMALLILAQIVTRWFGIILPSTEDFSGYLLAATSFLALAYTLHNGGHIRVNLLISHIQGLRRLVIEAAVLLVALILVSYLAWSCSLLVIESYEFEELSQGYIPVPLWIPQLPMAVGLVILALALADELITLLRGGTPNFLKHDESVSIVPDQEI